MKKYNCNLTLRILFLLALVFISACEEKGIMETGFLEGKISIGPLCPVETDPPDPGCLPTPETYKAYSVSIWTSDGRRKVTQIVPSLDGSYVVELTPGNYLVKMDKEQPGPGSSNLPGEITITANSHTILQIEIDTGIR